MFKSIRYILFVNEREVFHITAGALVHVSLTVCWANGAGSMSVSRYLFRFGVVQFGTVTVCNLPFQTPP